MKKTCILAMAVFMAAFVVFGACGASYIWGYNNCKKDHPHYLNEVEYANYRTLPYVREYVFRAYVYYYAAEAYLEEIWMDNDIMSGSPRHQDYIDARADMEAIIKAEDDPEAEY